MKRNMLHFPIDHVWIDDDALCDPMVKEIISKIPSATVFHGDRAGRLKSDLNPTVDPVTRGRGFFA